ncbi:MAG: AI-2E family transporter, partial [Atopostipes suicloacalis]|nr:AI-2E family transporter [Atopostipes suicloacalis]
ILILGQIIFGIGSLYPLLADQLGNFLEDFPELIASINESLRSVSGNLPFGASIEGFIDQGEEFLSNLPSNAQTYLTEGFTGLSKVIQSVSNVVVTIVVAPIMLFFLLKDDQAFADKALAICPPKWRKDLTELTSDVNSQVSAYVKGQLIIATALGVMVFISFSLIGLKYNGVLAIITGFTSVVPYLGPILAFTPALVIAVSSSWWMVVKLLIVWMLVQFLEGNVIQPNIMGKQLNIHPLTIIIVLLVAGDLLGLVGLILGVPLYAILRVIVRFVFKQFKRRYNRYYGDLAGRYKIKE